MQIETTRNHVLLITLATFRKMMTTGAVGRTWRDRVISYATGGNGKDTALGGHMAVRGALPRPCKSTCRNVCHDGLAEGALLWPRL